MNRIEGHFKEYKLMSDTSLDFMLTDSNTGDEVSFYFEGSGLRYVYDGISQLNQGDILVIYAIWNDDLKKQRAHEVHTPNSVIYAYYDKISYMLYMSIFCLFSYLTLYIARKKLTTKQ